MPLARPRPHIAAWASAQYASNNSKTKKKLKRWINNSITSWLIPAFFIEAFILAIVAALVFITVVAIVALPCIIGGIIHRLIQSPRFTLNDLQQGIENGFTVIVAIPIIGIGIPGFVVAILLTIAIGIVASLVGAVVGLVTLAGAAFKKPHNFWQELETREARQPVDRTEEQRQADLVIAKDRLFADLTAAESITPLINKGVDVDYIKFIDFNPNAPLLTLMPTTTVPEDLSTVEIIVASDGNYYLRSDVDAYNASNPGADNLLTYNPLEDLVKPEKLLKKFEPGVTTCGISLDTLTMANVTDPNDPVVRSIYGDFYLFSQITLWLKSRSTCPFNRSYLTDKYLVPVKNMLPQNILIAYQGEQPEPAPHSHHNNSNDFKSSSPANQIKNTGIGQHNVHNEQRRADSVGVYTDGDIDEHSDTEGHSLT